MLFLAFGLLELVLDCLDCQVGGLLESVGYLCGYHFGLSGHCHSYYGLLVLLRLGLDQCQIDVDVGNVGEAAVEAAGFLFYKVIETVSDLEVDGLNSNVHN